MENCPIHNAPFEWREAGISKYTGKPFNGFWSCRVKDDNGFCKQKPSNLMTAPAKFERSLDKSDAERRQKEKDEIIIRSVAVKAAATLCSNIETATVVDTLYIAQQITEWIKTGKSLA